MSRASGKPWLLDLVMLAALWGASFLFMRIGAPEFGALPTAAMRVGIGMVFLLPLMALRGQWPALRSHWRPALLIGMINSGVPFALFAFALLTINSGLGAVLNATVPMFGALVAWAWFGDRPDSARTLGLVIGFVGVAMLASGSAGLHSGADPSDAWWAIGACLGACLSYGIAASATRKYLQGMPSLAAAAGSQVGATVALVLPAAWLWPETLPSTQAWLAVVALGIACTGLAYVLFFRIIERAGPAKALTVTFLVPVFAVLYGVSFLGERITLWMLLCAAVIVCGVALSTGLVKFKGRAAVTTNVPPR